MVGFLTPTPESLVPQPFAAHLPHGLLLNADSGVLMLVTPRRWRIRLDLGCAWAVEPRNIETIDEAECLTMARMHEGLLRGLPIGSNVQVLMQIAPAIIAPQWETLRETCAESSLLASQIQSLRTGMPHRHGMTTAQMRQVRTFVTFRAPVPHIPSSLVRQMHALLTLPGRHERQLTARLHRHFQQAVDHLERLRRGIEETLQAVGHGVKRLDGHGIGMALQAAVQPYPCHHPTIHEDVALKEQVLTLETENISAGWRYGHTVNAQGDFKEHYRNQVLTLHTAPTQTYPGILSAPRAPMDGKPLALWDAWEGPLTIAVNLAIVDSRAAKTRLAWKRFLAGLYAGDSAENKALKKELDELQEQMFLHDSQLTWGRVHIVSWGEEQALRRGVDELIRRADQLKLGLALEEGPLGSTLFLQTLPLGFDQHFPSEFVIQRARRLAREHFTDFFPLYGAFQGSEEPMVGYLNRLGQHVGLNLYDRGNTNPHMLITGTTGAGKTFAVSHFIHQVLPLGSIVVALDPLTNYRHLCRAHGGELLSLSLNHPICINPFFGPLDKAHEAFIAADIAEMASGGIEPLRWEQFSVLADAVASFVQGWDKGRGEPTMSQFVHETLETGAFTQDRHAQRIGRELVRRLTLFFDRGQYAGFVDGKNQFELHKQCTVIELGELEEAKQLKGILFFSIFHQLTRFFRERERFYQYKHMIADEVWSLLRLQQTAEVVEQIIRTYRNYRTSAMFVSQRVSDFDSPIGRIIPDLCDVKMFLQQDEAQLARIEDIFELMPVEKGIFREVQKHSDHSTAFLRMSRKRGGIVKIIGDRALHFLSSQETQMALLREQLIEEYGTEARAVEAYLEMAT